MVRTKYHCKGSSYRRMVYIPTTVLRTVSVTYSDEKRFKIESYGWMYHVSSSTGLKDFRSHHFVVSKPQQLGRSLSGLWQLHGTFTLIVR